MTENEQYQDGLRHQHRRARRPAVDSRLTRSKSRRVAGVAGGVAEFVGSSPSLVRWIWLISLPLSGGLTGVAYFVLWALLPPPAAPSEGETGGAR